MPGTGNSKSSRRSSGIVSTVLCFLASAAVMAAAIAWFYRSGATLYYGDAEAHLNIARRIVDSRTPGWSQVGTTWLPLPHLLMIPLVRNDWMWRTGLAGAIVSGVSMSLAAAFLFASMQRIFRSMAAAGAAAAVFLLNPNTLYLGSVPMTEPVFLAALFALLYFTLRFAETQSWGAPIGAGIAGFGAALARYEGWFLLPFAAAYILICGRGRRWVGLVIFCAIAAAAPALWLAHNRWYFGDPLYFYRGPYSALAIQGKPNYPGKGDWRVAAQYFFAAGRLVAGWPAMLVGGAGLLVALVKRALWPLLFLALPPIFYVWSVHSSGTPVFVPTLWPHSFYNTRYGLAVLPPIALGSAAVVWIASKTTPRLGKFAAIAATAAALSPFLIHAGEHSIVWREAEVNSRARRQWIAQAADFLRKSAGPHETFFTSFGELSGIYRTLGIPLRDTLTGDNDVEWAAAAARPDLFLNTDWAVATGGDVVQGVVDKAELHGPRYELSRRFTVKGAPAIEIYRRAAIEANHENPVH
jgi:dolichyl-phosphate-mannose-protein mannosyltransferase